MEEEFTGGDPRDFNFQTGVSAGGTPRPLEYRRCVAHRSPAVLRLLPGCPIRTGLPPCCRAFNDWTIEHWLERDHRVVNAILVSPSDPAQAAEEIDRLGDRAGHRRRDGAVEREHALRQSLLSSHLGSVRAPRNCRRFRMSAATVERPELTPTPVGYPTLLHGIPNEPTLRRQRTCGVADLRGGCSRSSRISSLPSLKSNNSGRLPVMWHMDSDWKGLRDQTPWLKRLPSEYFRDHIRIGTQPMHEPEKAWSRCTKCWRCCTPTKRSSTAPIFLILTGNDPATVFPKLPEKLHRRIFADNAIEMLRLDGRAL